MLIPYETGTARYKEIARGQILGDDSGLLKMLFHREDRRLFGVHVEQASPTGLEEKQLKLCMRHGLFEVERLRRR